MESSLTNTPVVGAVCRLNVSFRVSDIKICKNMSGYNRDVLIIFHIIIITFSRETATIQHQRQN